MKTFTLDEAQSLLPVLESLLKRAIDGKRSAEEAESDLAGLAQRIYLSGGMRVNATSVARQRAEMEANLKRVRESIAEIDSIGVQVKDLEAGPAGFSLPARRRCGSALLAHGRAFHRALAHHGERLPGPSAAG